MSRLVGISLLFSLLLLPSASAQQQQTNGAAKLTNLAIEDQRVERLPVTPRPLPATDTPASLTLPDIELTALQRNPALAEASARIEAARGRWIQAGRYPNPVAGYHGTEIGNLGTAGQQGGFISQRFITGGKRHLDQAVANEEINEAQVFFAAQEWRVLNDVRIRFYDTLVSQRRVALTDELVRIAEEAVASSKRLLDARQISENDLLQAEIEAESSQILNDNARNQNMESWRRLAAVIGIPMMQPVSLQGELEADTVRFNWQDAYGALLVNSPELHAARIRVQRAEFALTRARRERIPNIDLSVSVRHIVPTDSDVANVQAGVPLPIFDANQGNIHRAESEMAAAEAEVSRMQLGLQDRLAEVYRRYASGGQQVERYRDRILPRAKRSLALVANAYSEGQVDYLTLLTSQRTYIRVSLAYLDALRALRESEIVMGGQLLRGSLDVPR